MSMSGLAVFDSTLHKTNIWLKDVMEELELDNRHHAYLALRGVLQTLRDHLSLEEVAQLSAQLPLLLRGIYFEGWEPTGKPLKERSKEAFLTRVYHKLTPGFDDLEIDMEQVVRAVVSVLDKHVSAGELKDVRGLLPKPVRALFSSPRTSVSAKV